MLVLGEGNLHHLRFYVNWGDFDLNRWPFELQFRRETLHPVAMCRYDSMLREFPGCFFGKTRKIRSTDVLFMNGYISIYTHKLRGGQ